jgi:hypothetical protein
MWRKELLMDQKERDLLKRIVSGEGLRLSNGKCQLGSQEEYETARSLEKQGLVRIFGSNGFSHGFPWTAVELTIKGEEFMGIR